MTETEAILNSKPLAVDTLGAVQSEQTTMPKQHPYDEFKGNVATNG